MNEPSKNALSVYVSTCRLALLTAQDDNLEEQNVGVNGATSGGKKYPEVGDKCGNELARQLACLRQMLSCTICGKIAIDPVLADENGSNSASLPYNQCGETEEPNERNLSLPDKTSAGCPTGNHIAASTVEAYNCRACASKMPHPVHVVPHVQGRLLIQCYRKLCQYLESTNFFRRLGSASSNIADLISEGAAVKEDYPGTCGYSNGQVVATYNNNHSLLSRLLAQPPLPSLDASPSQSNCDVMVVTTNGIEPPMFTSTNNMYSVSLTGSTHSTRITIKRKQAGSSFSAAVRNDGSSSPSSSSSSDSDVTLATLASASVSTSSSCKVAKVVPGNGQASWESGKRGTRPSTAVLTLGSKRKGCRCGNATLQPGKLTCCGQRCPCYVEGLPCDCCKCKGCRNPNRTSGTSSAYGTTAALASLESRLLRNQRLTTTCAAPTPKDEVRD